MIKVTIDQQQLSQLIRTAVRKELTDYFHEIGKFSKPMVLQKKEVMALLKIGFKRVNNLIDTGQLKEINGKITTESLEAYLQTAYPLNNAIEDVIGNQSS